MLSKQRESTNAQPKKRIQFPCQNKRRNGQKAVNSLDTDLNLDESFEKDEYKGMQIKYVLFWVF